MAYPQKPWQKKRKTPAAAAPPAKAGEHGELCGVVDSIVFRNEENGYSVCRVKADGHPEPVTVVGSCSAMWVGETLRAEGEWIRHPQHGFQFQAAAITCMAPSSAKGIERYLASGMIRGIGKVMAKRLVDTFGDDTLRIIEKESMRIEEIEGIGPIRRKRIKESWNEQKGVRDIMIFLQGHGIGSAQAARIYRQYGNESVAMVRTNPYRLCADVWGIGFKTADSVAMSLGIPEDSVIRARAGIVYVMRTLSEEGHCFCTEAELLLHTESLLAISIEILAEALKLELETPRLTKDEDRIYLAELLDAECAAADGIRRLLDTPAAFKPIIADKAVEWAQARMKLTFAPKQREALETALRAKVSIITGGPGVGKTTIIRALVDVYQARKLTVRLAAPTGRAAKRMAEATGGEALTIHRLLKFLPQTGTFEFNADKPLEGHCFILDEVSMIDIQLMAHVMRALPDAATLILVGDIDQLPSVGPGNVLRDLIQSGAIPCVALETIFRQESGGLIVRNAHRINQGEFLIFPEEGDTTADFYFIESEEPDDVIQRMIELVTQRIPKRFGLNPMSDIQVLTPMRRNQLGADNLNAVLQQALNPAGHEIERFGRKYRKGDRVMQVRNNYDKEVFNGDIGSISFVNEEDQEITVEMDGRNVAYDFSELDELVHAYASSIHKSQGSEYPAVVVLITTQHFKMLQRNLLYTAVTRGKRLVCIVGTRKAVAIAIRNTEIRQRRTGLKDRVRTALQR
jgi:exodeoxyribonuclease V alpha subunit